MLKLRPYKACDAQAITKWLKDEKAFRMWSADRYDKFPVTPEDINGYYDRDKYSENIWGMTAYNDDGIVGHFTMRYPDSGSSEIRLGFVIVDDSKRRQGCGKEMISMAVRYAFDFLKADKVTLGVFENNLPAIKCYQSCGFEKVTLEKTESYECMGEIWNCIEMQIMRNKNH